MDLILDDSWDEFRKLAPLKERAADSSIDDKVSIPDSQRADKGVMERLKDSRAGRYISALAAFAGLSYLVNTAKIDVSSMPKMVISQASAGELDSVIPQWLKDRYVEGKGYKIPTPDELKAMGFEQEGIREHDGIDRMPGNESYVMLFKKGQEKVKLYVFRANNKINGFDIPNRYLSFNDFEADGYSEDVIKGKPGEPVRRSVDLNAYGLRGLPDLEGFVEDESKRKERDYIPEIPGDDVIKRYYESSNYRLITYEIKKTGIQFKYFILDKNSKASGWYYNYENNGNFIPKVGERTVNFKKFV